MSDAVPLLQVENLRTYFRTGTREVKAVNDVSFSINPGETFCLVGESGSGKSITALSIIQLLPKDTASHPSGRILLQPRDQAAIPIDMLQTPEEQRRHLRGSRIAMIFQDPMTSLNPVFTIGEQIVEALQLHHPQMSFAEAQEKTITALASVQIPNPTERFSEYPHRLSGGQRQRVMIAMAIACEPDLLIADEPTTALDVTVQAEILKLMQQLQAQRNMSMLFITHDFGVVAQIGHRLGVMRRGQLVESGKVQDVLRAPQHDYTKQLLAALPEHLQRQPRAAVSAEMSARDASEPLLRIRNLKVHFPIKKGVFQRVVDHVRAVDDVSLDVAPGEILALVGESGCGKTTLGRAVLRLIATDGGETIFAGTNITALTPQQLRPYRRQMQIIFQDPLSSLNPRLSIADTLIEPMTVHGIGNSEAERIDIARQTLARIQLDPDYLWRYPHEFSGGQRQRIGIARALVLNPRLIVCDEITSALDVSVQAEILQLLLELRAERQLTLLFITHNIAVVEYLSDRIAVMNAGKIVEIGPTDVVCRAPQQAYTKKLLDAVPRLRVGARFIAP